MKLLFIKFPLKNQLYTHLLLQELLLPDNYNYENVTSLFISACSSASFHFTSLTQATKLQNIAVHNISDTLIFESLLTTKNIERLELIRIRQIPLITHDSFMNVRSIGLFRIEDTAIVNFEEQFTDINVTNFVIKNVMIHRMNGLNFSERGRTLRIRNGEVRNVDNNLNFAYFSDIEIVNSKFKLRKPGYLSIEGNSALVENSIFTNITMNLVATNKIKMNGTCADGKSSLRLSSSRIESFGNKLPTEIIYTKTRRYNDSELLLVKNNTVCIAGNCKCPKTNSQRSIQDHYSNFYIVPVIFLSRFF